MKVPISSAAEFETVMAHFSNGTIVHFRGSPYYVVAIEAKSTNGHRHSVFAELVPVELIRLP